MKFRLLFVPLLVLLSACGGGGNPTGPDVTLPPAPANGMVLTFASADLDVGFGGAVFSSGGTTKITDANGQVTFDQALPAGTPYEVTAVGYLPRLSVIRSDMRLPLVPVRTNLYDETFYRDMVFNQFMPGRRLSRPAQGQVFIQLSPEIASDATAIAAHQEAAALATQAVSGRIQFTVTADTPTQGAVVYKAGIVPDLPASGSTGSRFSGNVMTGGTLSYSMMNNARLTRLVLHELGHVLGLGHPTSQLALMNPAGNATIRDFTDAEKVVMYVASRQFPGTEYPHNDRNSQALGNARTTITIACGH